MLLLFLFVLASHCLECAFVFASGELRCNLVEREALYRFKKGLIDENGILSSWGSEEHKKECCNWEGIKCSNQTGHVVSLQLSYGQLRGKISSALLALSYLNHLDLSDNDFGYNSIPEFIGSFEKLRHMNLSYSNFSGVVPYQLGNLTNLRTLDLAGNDLVFENLNWVSHLSLLSILDLSNSSLSDTNLLQNIFKLPFLTELHLSKCNIFTHSLIWLVTSSVNISMDLRRIDMSKNFLSVIPDAFGKFPLLKYIDLSDNRLSGGIPKSFGNLSHLQKLILSCNNLSEPISELFYKLSLGANESLNILELDENQFDGSFPNNLGHFSKLERLDLSHNQITGPMPDLSALLSLKALRIGSNKLKTLSTSLWQLHMLEILDAASNSFEGIVSDADLSKLQKLKVLNLSYNSLVLNFTVDWIPPFQLDVISLACCKMGPRFPAWLQTQTNLSMLHLSCAGISDEVPKWLWDFSQRMLYLNVSHNQISGTVPDLSSSFVDFPILDISYNNFSGHLPLFHPNSWVLQLKNVTPEISLIKFTKRFL